MIRARLLCFAVLSVATTQLFAAAPGTSSSGPSWGGDAASTPSAAPIVIKNPTDLVVMNESALKLIIGTTVWDLKTLAPVGEPLKLPKLDYSGAVSALSPDGKYLAVGKARGVRGSAKTGDDSKVDVTIYDTETGAKLSEMSLSDPESAVSLLQFAAGKTLLVGSSSAHKSSVEVFDVQTGKQLRQLDCEFKKANQTAVSPDGRYFAAASEKTLQVYNIETGKSVLTAAPPPPQARRGYPDDGRPMMEGPDPYLFLGGLQFSPDGRELAGYFTMFSARIVAWDTRGFVTEDIPLAENRGSVLPDRATFNVSPDGACWMINGNALIDRKTKRCVWMRDTLGHDDIRGMFIDDSHFFVLHHSFRQSPEVIALPMAAIRKSLAAAADPKVPAVLRPGQSVSLELELQGVRGDVEAMRKLVLGAVTSRLAADNITVADGQPTLLKMNFQEGIGNPVKNYLPPTREDPSRAREINTGTFEARALLTYKVMARGSDKVYFADAIGVSRHSVTAHKASDAVNREELVQSLPGDLYRMELAYFIPQDPGLEMLPMGCKPHSYPADYIKPATDSSKSSPAPAGAAGK